MEFEIQREMVGAVIGKGGGTARSIRNRTGASVHVHSPQNENARTFVELRGRREQIESAFEELRSVVASVDEEYAKHMHASVTLKTKPESVGCLIGKQGQNIKQIEEDTRARVRVEPHEEGEEFQCVHVCGDVMAVELATQMVQESLDRYDATRAKKQQQQLPPHLSRMQVAPLKATELKIPPGQEISGGKTEIDVQTVPPIYIQAPAGGFGSQPSILVLQEDGTYHAAQIVANVDGRINAAGLVAIVSPPGVPTGIPSYVPPPQSNPLEPKAQTLIHSHQGIYQQQSFVAPQQQPQPPETKSHLPQPPPTFPPQNPAAGALVASQPPPPTLQQQQPSVYNQQNTATGGGYVTQQPHTLEAKSQPPAGYSPPPPAPAFAPAQDSKFQMVPSSSHYTQQTSMFIPSPPTMEMAKSQQQQFMQQSSVVYSQQQPAALPQQGQPMTVSQPPATGTTPYPSFQPPFGSQLYKYPATSTAAVTGWMTAVDQGQQQQQQQQPPQAPHPMAPATDATQADICASLNTVSFLQTGTNYPPPPS